jgi:hypothetical protein
MANTKVEAQNMEAEERYGDEELIKREGLNVERRA